MSSDNRRAKRRRVVCDYCHRDAELVGAAKLYPHRPELLGKWFWNCAPCGAYVGCHPGTMNPLGRLADAELRRAKQRVHGVLDPMWKSGAMKRREAYAALASAMGIAPQNCHVGMFDVQACEAACAAIEQLRQRA